MITQLFRLLVQTSIAVPNCIDLPFRINCSKSEPDLSLKLHLSNIASPTIGERRDTPLLLSILDSRCE